MPTVETQMQPFPPHLLNNGNEGYNFLRTPNKPSPRERLRKELNELSPGERLKKKLNELTVYMGLEVRMNCIRYYQRVMF